MSAIVFIDTNIFLDFYRFRTREKGLEILERINDIHDQIITTSQVEMEFKRNRQSEIVRSYDSIQAPDFGGLKQLPAFLRQSKQSSGLSTSEQKIKALSEKLRERTARVLQNPTRYDPVYKVAQRLFRSKSPINLDRKKSVRFAIRRKARSRYCLGYPPRKPKDTSYGDAINWEWIVHCAIESGDDVVIVSRDSDYGVLFGGKPVLNDWLAQEFKERVSKTRNLSITNRLSEGLKNAGVGVTPQEEDEEEEFLEERLSEKLHGRSGITARELYGGGAPRFSEVFSSLSYGPAYADALAQVRNQFDFPASVIGDAATVVDSLEKVRKKFDFQASAIGEAASMAHTFGSSKEITEILERIKGETDALLAGLGERSVEEDD